jgi:hypothetical protein
MIAFLPLGRSDAGGSLGPRCACLRFGLGRGLGTLGASHSDTRGDTLRGMCAAARFWVMQPWHGQRAAGRHRHKIRTINDERPKGRCPANA